MNSLTFHKPAAATAMSSIARPGRRHIPAPERPGKPRRHAAGWLIENERRARFVVDTAARTAVAVA